MKIAILSALIVAASLIDFAYAQPAASMSDPDFSDSAGDWDIEGFALGKGNTIICKMQKEAKDGSPFAEMLMMSAGADGFNIVDAYIAKSTLPDGSSPKVSIFFDGKKAQDLIGGVQKGFLHADLAKLDPISRMGRMIDLFKSSKSLAIVASLKGHPLEKTTVDLTDADDAFDKRAKCSKDVLDIGMERMKKGG